MLASVGTSRGWVLPSGVSLRMEFVWDWESPAAAWVGVLPPAAEWRSASASV